MVSNEEIIAALLQHGTAIEAAAALSVSPSTIYRRSKDPDFKVLYKSICADVLRQTVTDLSESRSEALEVIEEIMTDFTVNPAIRLQAAQSILSNDLRYSARLAAVEGEIEHIVTDQQLKTGAMQFISKLKKEGDS